MFLKKGVNTEGITDIKEFLNKVNDNWFVNCDPFNKYIIWYFWRGRWNYVKKSEFIKKISSLTRDEIAKKLEETTHKPAVILKKKNKGKWLPYYYY